MYRAPHVAGMFIQEDKMEGLDQLRRLIVTLKNLPKEVLKSADTAMVNSSRELLDLNREQLRGGMDSETKPLKYKRKRTSKLSPNNAYTMAYDRFKGKRGGNTSYVDLNLSGEFLNNMMLDHVALGRFKIVSESKIFAGGTTLEDELKYNYGKDIFGLWESNLQKFADQHLKPAIEFEVEHLITRI